MNNAIDLAFLTAKEVTIFSHLSLDYDSCTPINSCTETAT